MPDDETNDKAKWVIPTADLPGEFNEVDTEFDNQSIGTIERTDVEILLALMEARFRTSSTGQSSNDKWLIELFDDLQEIREKQSSNGAYQGLRNSTKGLKRKRREVGRMIPPSTSLEIKPSKVNEITGDQGTELNTLGQIRRFVRKHGDFERVVECQVFPDIEQFEKKQNLGYTLNLKDKHTSQQKEVMHAPSAEMLQQNLVDQFHEAFGVLNLDTDSAKTFADSVLHQTFAVSSRGLQIEPDARLTQPTNAPKLYKDRKLRSQKPDEFIRAVYSEWVALPEAFPRSVFKDIDPPLYTAISRYGLSEELSRKFPKSVGKPHHHADMSDSAILERKRQRDREASKRYRQRKKM